MSCHRSFLGTFLNFLNTLSNWTSTHFCFSLWTREWQSFWLSFFVRFVNIYVNCPTLKATIFKSKDVMLDQWREIYQLIQTIASHENKTICLSLNWLLFADIDKYIFYLNIVKGLVAKIKLWPCIAWIIYLESDIRRTKLFIRF